MHALDTLEFDVILEQLANHCDTPVGQECARDLLPSFDEEEVWRLIGLTGEALELLDVQPISLSGIGDVAQAAQYAAKGGGIDGASLWRIGESLKVMRAVRGTLHSRREEAEKLWAIGEGLPSHPELESRLLASLDGDGSVRDEASAELQSARGRIGSLQSRIQDGMQKFVSGKFRTLLSDPLFTQRSGRYVLPVKAENKGKIKGIVHDVSASGQTVYVEPEQIVALGNELREAEAAERAEVARVLSELSELVGDCAEDIVLGLELSAELDLIFAKARYGAGSGGVIPKREKGTYLRLELARHPLLDRKSVVPLTIDFGREHDAVLITGPNTGGKTVAIKTIGLSVAMAQSGLMPTAEAVRLGAFTQIWADIGDEQSIQQSLSTFSAHIKNIAAAIKHLVPGALVLLDELGAGTDPAEGAALGRAILLKLQQGGACVIASTHYGELKLFAENTPRFMNASMEFDQKSLRPTYRLMAGVPGSSHAMTIAKRYGVPSDVIAEAMSGVSEEELDVTKMIERLEAAERRARGAQSESDRLSAELRELKRDVEARESKAQQAITNARAEAAEEMQDALAEMREETSAVLDTLKASGSQRELDEAREKLKRVQEEGASTVEEFQPEQESREPLVVSPGMSVRAVSLKQTGVVVGEPRGGSVQVQIGSMKIALKLTDLEEVVERPKARRSSTRMRTERSLSASREIHLRRLRYEDAREELERFIDDAVLAGLSSVRIVHGKGGGALRKLTDELLRRHPAIKSHRLEDVSEGGDGVTVAHLK